MKIWESTVTPEHFDIGKLQLAVLQPVQAGGKATSTTIVTEAAIAFYTIATTSWNTRGLTALASKMETSTS